MSGNWTLKKSRDLYRVDSWGGGYFGVNDDGHIAVTPRGPSGPSLDLKVLVDQLRERGLGLPLLIRFPSIINSRIDKLYEAFANAIETEGYRGSYRPVYPIKVNQQRRVVDALLHHGAPHQVGLEAGSKPEVLVALAMTESPEAPLILNGYKDHEFVETALLATRLGRNAIVVVDRFHELELILRTADRLGIPPRIGVRAQLDAKADGRWTESSGLGSKFGLESDELVDLVERLREAGQLDSLVLLHFHIGSQVTDIRGLKEAAQEAGRVFGELVKLGAPLQYLDVGGGLGVDYDGTQSTNASSVNYGLQEYANNVVFHVREMCDEMGVDHPDLISESGRALVAHHSLLVTDVRDMDEGLDPEDPRPVAESEHRLLRSLYSTWESISDANLQECWHDANHSREEAVTLFANGVLDLRGRARADELFRACSARILKRVRRMREVPEEFDELERQCSDIYFANFSIFQSAPDHWAVGQVFPVMPIHRLDEEPVRRGVVADLTCDSDGLMDHFAGSGERSVLRLHELNESPYYLGIFLLGAYQEILGDLHNLFGDTNAVHVDIDEDGAAVLLDVDGHDTVSDVLRYVGFERRTLMARMRRAVERALREGSLSLRESRLFLRDFEHGLSGTTYLEDESDDPADRVLTDVRLDPPKAPDGQPQ
ncbi:MAG: biosynthetic arginine decarboxylase [Gemmatimonadetes bacterium]|nr:biosynthetic arginine decarboxylase [Gemmatimonadota bacterium]